MLTILSSVARFAGFNFLPTSTWGSASLHPRLYADACSAGSIHHPAAEPHSQPTDQQLPFVNHFRRQAIVKIEEQLFVTEHFLTPRAAIE